jgi:hypothetical protein
MDFSQRKSMVSSKRVGGSSAQFGQGAGQSPCLTDGMEYATEAINKFDRSDLNGVGSGDSAQFGNSIINSFPYKDLVGTWFG